MSTWQERLIAERDELSDKLRRLEHFLVDEANLDKMSKKEAALLIAQSYAMHQYLDILDIRLTYAKKD